MKIDIVSVRWALNQAWSRHSSSKWSSANPAGGQCSPTALGIQDCFGGTLLKTPIEGAWHFYNCIEGQPVDFTAQQFQNPPVYQHQAATRAEALLDCTVDQYTALVKRFSVAWTKWGSGQLRLVT